MFFRLPPLQRNFQGEIRRVGFEFEFTGIDMEGTAALLLQLFGGTLRRKNKFLYEIEESCHGRYTIELDAAILTSKAYEGYLRKLGINFENSSLSTDLEKILAMVASTVVPYEIISPPLPLTELQAMEELRIGLQQRHAVGTRGSLLYAFGLHLNPEAPSLRAEVILSYLRAFLLLYDWLHAKARIDFSRRLVPFIHEFPESFGSLILQPAYRPDMARLIDDYLRHNPTRNRPLDLLPLLAFIDEERIMAAAVEKHLIKPRPAFHYRLPNCLIDDPAWSIAGEWNYWLEVEKLALDQDKIRRMSLDFLETMQDPLGFLKLSWAAKVEKWYISENASR